MKPKTTKRTFTKTAVGAAIGGLIGGPVGAVAGGIAGHGTANEGLADKPKGRASRKSAAEDDPIVHAGLKSILVPLDFSQPSQRAMRFAAEWATRFGSEVCLLHVVESTATLTEFGTVPASASQRDFSARAKAALEELARKEFSATAQVRVEIRQGVPYDQIAIAARELNSDVIIIATHGRSGLSRVLMGSTAERVVRHAPCPVLTLRRRQTA